MVMVPTGFEPDEVNNVVCPWWLAIYLQGDGKQSLNNECRSHLLELTIPERVLHMEGLLRL